MSGEYFLIVFVRGTMVWCVVALFIMVIEIKNVAKSQENSQTKDSYAEMRDELLDPRHFISRPKY